MTPSRLFVASLLILTLAAPALEARGKGPKTAPGKYTEWNDEIDELEIVRSFKLSDYERIVVEPFDTAGTPLPEAGDNTYEPVKQVLGDVAAPFVEGLSEGLGGKIAVAAQAKGAAAGPKALLIRGKVLTMDPGSKAARYWAGFGAGAARAQISGEVVDAANGEVLLRFTQERRSGVGLMGGDYVKLMNRNLRTIGEDVAGTLAFF